MKYPLPGNLLTRRAQGGSPLDPNVYRLFLRGNTTSISLFSCNRKKRCRIVPPRRKPADAQVTFQCCLILRRLESAVEHLGDSFKWCSIRLCLTWVVLSDYSFYPHVLLPPRGPFLIQNGHHNDIDISIYSKITVLFWLCYN